MDKVKVYFKEGVEPYDLKPAHDFDAGIDIRNQEKESITLCAGERRLFKTGLHVSMPEGYEIQLRPRSGLALRNGITLMNSPSTIDYAYRGEIGVILYNASDTLFEVKPLERIAQMVIAKVETPIIPIERVESLEDLGTTERGSGGFGSTGTA